MFPSQVVLLQLLQGNCLEPSRFVLAQPSVPLPGEALWEQANLLKNPGGLAQRQDDDVVRILLQTMTVTRLVVQQSTRKLTLPMVSEKAASLRFTPDNHPNVGDSSKTEL